MIPAAPVLTPEQEVAALRELLAQHQELDRVQGNRVQDLERERDLARAQLAAATEEIRRLQTQTTAQGKP